ncbi:hypothetical protein [Occultella kanbiaonis]|uniref:hypothetical protein n=1 Tax=Occultella kanbiaonis TaxID=2675754 RepID=UPI0012B8BD3B|nr:hypothetical protein [Occultella kanbiaonis]
MRDLVLSGTACLCLLAAAGLVGCASTDRDEATDADIAHVPYEGTEGADGALEGTLARQGGCTTIETAAGDIWVPVFPDDGVRWRGDELDLSTIAASHLSVRAGDIVQVAGGEGDPPDDAVIPEGCEAHSNVWLVTPH